MPETLATLTPETHAARGAVYRFFATAFRYPDQHVARALASPPPGLTSLEGALWAADATLEDEYVRTFGHSVPKEFPPFETEFTSAQTFRQTADLADIAGFYRAFGVRVVPELGERLDALEVELEFLHLLAMKEAHALARGEAEHASVVAAATRKFLSEHVGRWVPSFAKRLTAKGRSPLYRALADALGAWIRQDLETLGVRSPQPVDEPALLTAPDWNAEADAALAEAEDERSEQEQLERARAENAIRPFTAP
jgi:DMSO reductase family type II enzyme chaperone